MIIIQIVIDTLLFADTSAIFVILSRSTNFTEMSEEEQSRRMHFPRQSSFIQPDVNPFVHNLHLTRAQKMQVALMSATVAPIRIALFALCVLMSWLLTLLFTIGMSVNTPIGPIRRFFCNTLRFTGRCCLFFLGFHWIHVRGKRMSAEEAPFLVVAPHSSLFDALIAFVTDPIPSAVSRIENSSVPILSTLSRAVQPVFVSRKDAYSRQKTINELKRRANMPGCWPQITIFPEGTCTNRKALITFKAGSFIPGKPVQPVLLEYLNDLDTVTWTMSGPESLTLLWLSLCQFQLNVRVTYLPVYKPSQSEIENPKLYASNVRALMADALNISCTDHTFEDCRLMRQAASLNMPMEAGLVEFAKVSRKLGMDIDSVHGKLLEFSHIASENIDGKISIENFANFLNMPVTAALQEMFNLYDRDQSGLIDFREYVIGLSLVSQPTVTNSTVQLAFTVFDQDKSGMISEADFIHVLHSTFGDEFDGRKIFKVIKKAIPDRITYEEFFTFVQGRPEYAKLFVWYKDMKQDVIEEDQSTATLSSDELNHSVTRRKFLQDSNKVEDINATGTSYSAGKEVNS